MDETPSLADLQREHGTFVGSRRVPPKGELAEQSPLRNYIRDIVLGYNDGLVSVYALMAGVAGAALSRDEILIAGLAASVAGALSMAAGEFISTKSQAQFYRSERKREEEHLAKWPEIEKQELRHSFRERGLEPPLLDQVVEAISSDRNKFLDYMMRDEFGIGKESERSPWRASLIVVAAFLVGAAFALLPYVYLAPAGGLIGSTILSLAALFLAGAIRARASRLPVLSAGLEMVLIGAFAGAVTYGIGRLIGAAI